jgi:lipopolysaccharide transport system ATP-binding protein
LRFRCGLTAGTYFLNAGVVAHLGHGEEYVNRWVDVGMFRVLVDRSSLFTGLVDFDVSTQLKVTA